MAIYFYTDKNGKKTSVTGGQLDGLVAGGVIRPGTIVASEDGTPLIVNVGGVLTSIHVPPNTTARTPKRNGATTAKPPFCTNCGNPVSKWVNACPSCGADPTKHKKFCRNCGTALNPEQVVCVNCKASVKTNGKTVGASVGLLVLGIIAGVWFLSAGAGLLGIIILVVAIGTFLHELVQMAKN